MLGMSQKKIKIKGTNERQADKGPPKHLWEGLREAVSSPQLIITGSLTEMLLHGESEAHWVALLLRD